MSNPQDDKGYTAYPLFDFPKSPDQELLAAVLGEVVKALQAQGTVFVYGEHLTVAHLHNITTTLIAQGWMCRWNMKREMRVDAGGPRTVVRIDAHQKL